MQCSAVPCSECHAAQHIPVLEFSPALQVSWASADRQGQVCNRTEDEGLRSLQDKFDFLCVARASGVSVRTKKEGGKEGSDPSVEWRNDALESKGWVRIISRTFMGF